MKLGQIEKLDLQVFERVCRVFFEQMGFTAKATGAGALPGIGEFVVLYSRASNTPFSLLQCAVGGAKVDISVLTQFKNAMGKLGLNNGYFMLTDGTEPLIREFATANRINFIDGAKFLELFNNLPEAGRQLLQEALTAGAVPAARMSETGRFKAISPVKSGTAPACGKCGTTMKLQVKMKGPYETGKFWQCPKPGCGFICAYL